MNKLERNTTLLGMDGWMGRLDFFLCGLKASLIILIPFAILAYAYGQFSGGQIEEGALPSPVFVIGVLLLLVLYSAIIYPAVVRRLRDIVGPDIKRPKLLALIIVIGLYIPIVGSITGLFLTFYPGKLSAQEKSNS